ncbi:PAS domain S-box protein, partial [Salmonella enterica subsp. enterica]|nr:PAS domain S-box protein [Salmonella enterica subsp. enterica serovar Enteritidis]
MDTPEVIASPLPSEARLRAIVESSFDAIVGKNLNSIITDWNPAAERLFGYAADEAIGRSIVMLIPDDLVREETEIIRQIASGNQVPSFDTVRKHKDGTLIDVSVTVSPIRDQAGVIVGASKIARDIRQKKEADRRIRVLLREVNHRVKNQFSVILSVLRETSRRATDTASFVEILEQRIMGLSRSQDILVSSGWTGAELAELVCDHL